MWRPRMTTRRLMIAVAILAFAFGAIKWVADMRARSAAYSWRAGELAWNTRRSGSMVRTADGRSVSIHDNENVRLMDAWTWQMVAKYRRLSYYPWLAVEPDPPPPQLLARPRSALDLPEPDSSLPASVRAMRPPVWTVLWTWRTRPIGIPLWE